MSDQDSGSREHVDVQSLAYEPNPKHKPTPTPGRRGSICPRDVDATALLRASTLWDNKRYATDGTNAYCAQRHSENSWHGYPVGWDEVPPAVVAGWVAENKVERRTIRRAKRRQV